MLKIDKKALDDLADQIEKCEGELESEIADFNDSLDNAFVAVADKVAELNELLGEARGFIEEAAGEMEEYYDDKSDNWKEGDKGETYYDWMAQFQNACLDDIEIEQPEPIEHDGIDFNADDYTETPDG